MKNRKTVIGRCWPPVVIGTLLVWSLGSGAQAAIILDPVGDTFGVGTPAHDIIAVSADVVGTDLVFVVSFVGSISAPSGGVGDAIEGFIDIDTDQNAATGTDVFAGFPSHLDQFGQGAPSPSLGVEFFLDIGSEFFQAGLVDLVRTSDTSFLSLPISFAPTSFSVSVPLADLGGDDGQVSFGAIFGPFGGPSATDQAPNNAAVPEPSSFTIFGLGLVGAVVFWRRSRQRRACGVR